MAGAVTQVRERYRQGGEGEGVRVKTTGLACCYPCSVLQYSTASCTYCGHWYAHVQWAVCKWCTDACLAREKLVFVLYQ